MANPNKAQDPAAAALSAIEEALHLSGLGSLDFARDEQPRKPSTQSAEGQGLSSATFGEARRDKLGTRLPSAENDAGFFAGRSERQPSASQPVQTPPMQSQPVQSAPLNVPVAPSAPVFTSFEDVYDNTRDADARSPVATPANDDRESVGALLRALQARPSRTPMLIAGAASVLWIGLCAFYIYADRANIDGAHLLQPKTALVLLAVVGPLLFFFITAALTRRAQEMRITARSMLQVAARLAEPDALATERVVTLSQAIRREIAAMGDGVERALARAGELETMVRSEVSDLERSFGENERRVRSLIIEMTNEREAISANLETLRGVLEGAQTTLSQDFSGFADRLSTTLEETSGRVTGALGGRGEEVRLALVEAGEACTANLVWSAGDLVERLRRSTDEAVGLIGARTGDLEGKIFTAGQQLVDDLAARSNEICTRFDEVGTRLNDELANRGDGFAARLAETSDRLTDTIATHGDTLDATLGGMGERMSTLLGERLGAVSTETLETLQAHANEMGDRIAAANEALTAHHQMMNERLVDTTQQTINALAEHTQGLHERLEATAADTLGALDTHSGTIGDRLEAVSRETVEGLSTHTERLETLLRETSAEAVGALDHHRETLLEQLGTAATEIVANIGGHIQAVHERLVGVSSDTLAALDEHAAAMHERLSTTAGEAVENLAGHLDGMHEQLAANAEATAASLTQQAEALQESFVGDTRQAIESLAEQVSELNARFAQIATDSVTAIATHGDRMNEALSERISALIEHGGAASDRISEQAERFNATISDRLGAIEHTVTTRGSELHENLGVQIEASAALVERQILELGERATERTQAISESLEGLIARIGEGLETRGRAINEALAARAMEIARALANGGREITDALELRTREVHDLFEARSADFGDQLKQHIAQLNQRVIEPLNTIASSVGEKGSSIRESLAEQAAAIEGVLGAIEVSIVGKGEALSETLTARSNELATLFDARGDGFVARLSADSKAIQADLERVGDDVIRAIAQRGQAVVDYFGQRQSDLLTTLDRSAEELRHVLEGSVAGSVQAMAERQQSFAAAFDALANRLKQDFAFNLSSLSGEVDARRKELSDLFSLWRGNIAKTVDNGIDQARQVLGERHAALTTAVDQSRASLQETVEGSVTGAVKSLLVAHEILRGELGNVVDRLGDSNAAVREAIGSANANAATFDKAVAARVGELQGAIESITGQIGRMAEDAARVLASAGSTAERISGHHRMLIESADRLANSQTSLERKLNERQQGLATLIDATARRMETVEGSMKSLSGLIEDNFGRAEIRMREITRQVADQAQQSTSAIDERLRAIRLQAAAAGEETSNALNASHAHIAEEIDGIFGDVMERFRLAASEIRDAAHVIQEELTATREEVRRNAFELPQETAEQAETMRRVVLDQIKALNELTNLVHRSGRALDLGDEDALQEAETMAKAQKLRQQIAAATASARLPTPVLPTDQNGARGGNGIREIEAQPPSQAAGLNGTAPRLDAIRTAEDIRRLAAPRAGSGQQGWLSDLLQRASLAEDVPPEQPQGSAQAIVKPSEAAEAISTDMARMVDADAAATAWERYRRGERGVFGRHIYVGRGQQVFEDVRRRYAADPGFGSTVDRYLQEFERLLSQIRSDDPDQRMLRGYLGSDSGKVYTLLAHASGRLS